MLRIESTFKRLQAEHRSALIPFITAGDPNPAATLPLMHALVRGGADILEIGVPFSDPMADGPTVQRASERALAAGMSLAGVLKIVQDFRATDKNTPVVLMGYANPIEAMGQAAFCDQAYQAGVDGVLVVDYPPEEGEDFSALLKGNNIAPIFLLSPTSSALRRKAVAALGSGYVYYVSLRGVTGSSKLDLSDVAVRLPAIREEVGMPVGVGFGIRDAQSAKAVAAMADAVVIGSRLIEEIEASPPGEAPARLEKLLAEIRRAMDDGRLEKESKQ